MTRRIALALAAGMLVFRIATGQPVGTYKVAMVIAQGGLGDQSYNDLADAGLTRAEADFPIEAQRIQSPDIVAQGQAVLFYDSVFNITTVDLDQTGDGQSDFQLWVNGNQTGGAAFVL